MVQGEGARGGYKANRTKDPLYDGKKCSTLATMWSDPLIDRPESQMTGVSFSRGGYAHMPNSPDGTGGYTVWQPEHWVYEGTGLQKGDVLGDDDYMNVTDIIMHGICEQWKHIMTRCDH